jgi:hypothetical protein
MWQPHLARDRRHKPDSFYIYLLVSLLNTNATYTKDVSDNNPTAFSFPGYNTQREKYNPPTHR